MSSDGGAPASHKPGGGHHEEEHEEHVNHEAWVIPYADMLTLLMALFLMLWATSSVTDEKKFAALADALRDSFSTGTGELTQVSVQAGSVGILEGQDTGVEEGDFDRAPKVADPEELNRLSATDDVQNSPTAKELIAREMQRAEAEAQQNAVMTGIQQRIEARAKSEGVLDALQFRREERGLVVTVVSDNVLFDSGSAALQPKGAQVLGIVTDALKGVPNNVVVEGHTDDSPINTERYPSNWELSSHRGTSVLRFMTEAVGFDANRIASTGYGQTKPIKPNDSPANKAANRRVELVILKAV